MSTQSEFGKVALVARIFYTAGQCGISSDELEARCERRYGAPIANMTADQLRDEERAIGELRRSLYAPAAPAPKSGLSDAERAARVAIRDEIHRRDEIVLGRDPLGRLCGCEMCANPPTWMDE